MTGRIAALLWLVIVWLAALESLTSAAVAAGAGVAGMLLVVFRHHGATDDRLRVRLVPLCSFLGYFTVKLLHANIHVARAVIRPSASNLRRAIVAVPVAPAPDTAVWLLANAVSLTPGTSVVELRERPPTFYVHVLHLHSIEETRLEVLEMQRRLMRAVGSPEIVRDIEHRIGILRAGGGRLPRPEVPG